MTQESTMICLDNSEWMRNGDMSPNRLQCQQEAIRVLIQYKLRSNPENAVGALAMAKAIQVLSSMTNEDRKLLSRLHQVQINLQGASQVIKAIKTAHLVLKNRPNRNHKTRIVVFIGSPLDDLEKEYGEGEFLKLAKKLKKENVKLTIASIKVDFVLFGEATAENNQIIVDFVDTLNGGKDSTTTGATGTASSNVVVVPGDARLFEALLSSPICRNDDGTMPAGAGAGGAFGDFGFDADDDPELALALRVSLEEQRQRQQHEAGQQPGGEGQAAVVGGPAAMDAEPLVMAAAGGGEGQAPAQGQALPTAAAEASLAVPLQLANLDPAAMSEEEQIEWALRMSIMQPLDRESGANQGSASITGGGGSTGGSLLKPVPIYGHLGAQALPSHDDDVLSSAGATASGTPAPTPMEADLVEGEEQHSTALGQLMDNPELLRQLVDQIPGGMQQHGAAGTTGSGGRVKEDEETEESKAKRAKKNGDDDPSPKK